MWVEKKITEKKKNVVIKNIFGMEKFFWAIEGKIKKKNLFDVDFCVENSRKLKLLKIFIIFF